MNETYERRGEVVVIHRTTGNPLQITYPKCVRMIEEIRARRTQYRTEGEYFRNLEMFENALHYFDSTKVPSSNLLDCDIKDTGDKK